MKFIDEYHFKAAAGKGGDGVVRWRREKFMPMGGPSGGNGGKGGDLLLVGVRDIRLLARIVQKTVYTAEHGHPGERESKTGRDGEDLVVKLPLGSVVTNRKTGQTIDIVREDEPIVLLRGGAGGMGNEHFKSSSNQAPREHTLGSAGEEGMFDVELRLIADVGLVGLPNAGKTSLLNALTNAHAKVGAYQFTTLDPNLGVYHDFVIADIPGLIEGASEGKGLGHKFLRHISRTRLLVHCVSLEQEKPLEDYKVVQGELAAYEGVSRIPELVVLTKTDCVDTETLDRTSKAFAEQGIRTLAVSVLDDVSVQSLGDELVRVVRSL